MPNLNGIDMSIKIKEYDPKRPIIVTTAFDDTSYLVDAITIGIDKYVLKPIKFNTLIENIIDVLEKSHQSKGIIQRNSELTSLLALLNDIIFDENFNLDALKSRIGVTKKHITVHDIEMFM